jgi:hypothetical protein
MLSHPLAGARLGHSGTAVTEPVYRNELRPVIQPATPGSHLGGLVEANKEPPDLYGSGGFRRVLDVAGYGRRPP